MARSIVDPDKLAEAQEAADAAQDALTGSAGAFAVIGRSV